MDADCLANENKALRIDNGRLKAKVKAKNNVLTYMGCLLAGFVTYGLVVK